LNFGGFILAGTDGLVGSFGFSGSFAGVPCGIGGCGPHPG
jgi:hypothetical protein